MSYINLYKKYKNSRKRSFNRKQHEFEMQTFNIKTGIPTALLRKLNRTRSSSRSRGGSKRRTKRNKHSKSN